MSLVLPPRSRTWVPRSGPTSVITRFGKRSARTERGRPAPAIEPEQPAIPVRLGVDGICQTPGSMETNQEVVNSIPYMVYFLEDEETLAKVPSMLPLLLGSVKSPRIPMNIEGEQIVVLLDTGAEVSVLPKSLMDQLIGDGSSHVRLRQTKAVRPFANPDVQIQGPWCLTVTICGVKLTHPFYTMDADIPIVVGIDLLTAAKVVIDVMNKCVYCHHYARLEVEPCTVQHDQFSWSITSSTSILSLALLFQKQYNLIHVPFSRISVVPPLLPGLAPLLTLLSLTPVSVLHFWRQAPLTSLLLPPEIPAIMVLDRSRTALETSLLPPLLRYTHHLVSPLQLCRSIQNQHSALRPHVSTNLWRQLSVTRRLLRRLRVYRHLLHGNHSLSLQRLCLDHLHRRILLIHLCRWIHLIHLRRRIHPIRLRT